MRGWLRALVVPLVVVAIWSIPSGRPDVEIAGAAETAALTEIAEDGAATTSTTASSSTTTTVAETAAPPISSTAPLVPTTTVAPTTVAPTTSEAPTTAEAPTTTRAQSLGDLALQRVSFDWRSAFPRWDVEFKGPRNGLRALTYPKERRVVIFVRSSDTADTLHRVFAHELGHIIDVELNSDNDRSRWLEQRNIRESAAWWPSAEAPDFGTGAGDFAEAFAVLETGVTTRSTLASQPSSADLDLLRELSRG